MRTVDVLAEMVKSLEATDRLTAAIVEALEELVEEQAELRDEVHALSNRIESVARQAKAINDLRIQRDT